MQKTGFSTFLQAGIGQPLATSTPAPSVALSEVASTVSSSTVSELVEKGSILWSCSDKKRLNSLPILKILALPKLKEFVDNKLKFA